MDLIKKHYEKVLLGVVLLGLTVAVALLPFIINGKREALEAKRTTMTPKPKPLPALDMTAEDAALQRVQSAVKLDFTSKHNLFNPVVWQKLADGRLLKIQTGNEVGAGALVVTDIRPLYLQVTYDSPNATGYFIFVERAAATDPGKRPKHQALVVKDEKKELFTLRDVKGPPEKPTELVLELNETGDSISLATDKPYKKVEGYEADLKYGVDNKLMTKQRVGATLNFGGGQYNIVAITETNVVLSAKSNAKKTTITFSPATEPPR